MEILETIKQQENGLSDRVFALGYSLFSYMIGAGSLFWLIFAAGGYAPLGLIDVTYGNEVLALCVNVLLVILFGVQHSIMARTKFKNRLVNVIPRHLERATFVLVSGILTFFIIAMWQVVDATVWSAERQVVRVGLMTGYAFGVLYLLSSSFVTNHFELFGLRQAWLYFANKPYTPLQFKQRLMYRFSRHPMMLGFIFIFWCSPDMSVTRFTLALLFTIYIFEGIRHEESELIEEFGDNYRDYQKKIGLFFTFNKN